MHELVYLLVNFLLSQPLLPSEEDLELQSNPARRNAQAVTMRKSEVHNSELDS